MLKLECVSALRPGLIICAALIGSGAVVSAQHALAQPTRAPEVAAASDEGERAIKRFTVAPGLKTDLFAAEPHLANPVSFCFDERGRVYVAETFRLGAGVDDIRGIMDWLDDELSAHSVEDRRAYMQRRLGERFASYSLESERVKLLEDRDGDGRIDHSTVFATGFNDALDGIGAGVLARKGDVYFADIPNLWRLRDTKGTGTADVRQVLHTGYGVRFGFLGHDLHGLRFGPDGKLYFSIGDRGASITTEGRKVESMDAGCVFRCNADGSGLEIFATGLRNPQDLAFDQFGNLWTGDNNSDSGDQARWVYLVEGADNGWRAGYQFMERPYSRGPFNEEKLWYPQWDGQAAYIVPPITNLSSGPSGLAYYPGTGLPESFNDHFFLSDFHGDAGSLVHTFAVKPKGASFELVDAGRLVKGLLATDVKFGVDGGVYVLDWVQGWNKTGKGRIYRFHDPAVDQSAIVLETKKILADGMTKRSLPELARLLAHRDQRVRQEAQFELADRRAAKTLAPVAAHHDSPLARLHALWGLGQLATRQPAHAAATLRPLLPLLHDPDAEVRAHAARLLGDHHLATAGNELVKLLQDSSARVRFFSAISLGKLGHRAAVAPLLAVLRENKDQDATLRHGVVMGLTGIGDVKALLSAAEDPSPAVRRGVLVALRRLGRPEVARFLNDAEPTLVLEAARAINDAPINAAMPQLAALLPLPARLAGLDEQFLVPLLRRVLNANFRLGTADGAAALARFAAGPAPEILRVEAMQELIDWPAPSGRDRIMGLWRPVIGARDRQAPAAALQPVFASLVHDAPANVRVVTARAAGRLALPDSGALLAELATDARAESKLRVEALKALAALKDTRLAGAVQLAQADSDENVRKEGTRLAAQLPAADATAPLRAALEKGSIAEKQSALAALGAQPGAAADELLGAWLDKLLAGQTPKELQLDVLEAAGKRTAPAVTEKLARYEAAQPKDDSLPGFRPALAGGNAEEGRKIFLERAEVACVRCHKVGGEGGDVGPDLTGLGARQPREYILESILFPNRQIAAGFESVIVTKKDGVAYAGVLKSETDQEIVINSPEDGLVTVAKSDLKARDRGLSAMPEGFGQILTKQDVRNLVEFLSTAK